MASMDAMDPCLFMPLTSGSMSTMPVPGMMDGTIKMLTTQINADVPRHELLCRSLALHAHTPQDAFVSDPKFMQDLEAEIDSLALRINSMRVLNESLKASRAFYVKNMSSVAEDHAAPSPSKGSEDSKEPSEDSGRLEPSKDSDKFKQSVSWGGTDVRSVPADARAARKEANRQAVALQSQVSKGFQDHWFHDDVWQTPFFFERSPPVDSAGGDSLRQRCKQFESSTIDSVVGSGLSPFRSFVVDILVGPLVG